MSSLPNNSPRLINSKSDARKKIIFRALHDCILSKGYVKTTLADIARESGMTASHLLYYFRGKEAILEQYFKAVSVLFLKKIAQVSAQPKDKQLELLADCWFNSEAGTKQEIGFMLECFGVAVNDDTLLGIKVEFDKKFKLQLTAIISAISASPNTLNKTPSHDLAEIVYALIIGLRSAVYFSTDLSLESAHKLFCRTVRSLN